MAQSDARFDYRANLARTDHDLSQKFGFTTPPGMLLPIWMDFATPGDSYYLQHDLSFMRTAPLLAPAMIDVLVHYETFFVPIQLLYQPFEDSNFSLKSTWTSFVEYGNLRNYSLPVLNYNRVYERIMAATSNIHKFDFHRLCDMFDINIDVVRTSLGTGSDWTGNYGFPMFPAAYQCIYEYYYRLDDKSNFSQMYFNMDKYYNTNLDHNNADVLDMFKIRYRPWNFDFYTSTYRSPIVSSVNTQPVMPDASYEFLFDGYSSQRATNTLPIENAGVGSNANNNTVAYSTKVNWINNPMQQDWQTALSTVMVRQMFANEKLAMITGRTRKNYDSQVLAHYGVKVPHDVKHDISLVGRDTYKLRIGEVTSLASTELSPLGEIAGKGFASGSSGKKHKFTAPCHGVLMTIFSIEPQKRYHHSSSKYNFISVTHDLPTPEFDRLGNMPVLFRELAPQKNAVQSTLLSIVGWKERYYFAKRKADRVSLAFMHQPVSTSGSHNVGNLNPYSAYFISSVPLAYDNNDIISSPGEQSAYYISVNCMDDLMLVPYIRVWQSPTSGQGDSTTGEDWNAYPYMAYARDPFIVDSYIKCKKVSWMSKDGEPIYNY